MSKTAGLFHDLLNDPRVPQDLHEKINEAWVRETRLQVLLNDCAATLALVNKVEKDADHQLQAAYAGGAVLLSDTSFHSDLQVKAGDAGMKARRVRALVVKPLLRRLGNIGARRQPKGTKTRMDGSRAP